MKTKYLTAMAIAVALTAGSVTITTARGQNILDQQLGPKPAETPKPDAAKPDAPKPGDSPAQTPKDPTTPKANTDPVINPDAVKQVDDNDLINKLTNPGEAPKGPQSDPQVKMKDMLERMDQSKTFLTKRDPGKVTQETQQRILTDLDVLIEYARKQEQTVGSSQQQGPPEQGQSRQQGNGSGNGPHNPGGNNAAQQSGMPGGGISGAAANSTDLHQRAPDEWGSLPPRDRDLVSHGANQEFLPAYREMIDAYYKALAEMGKKPANR